MSDKLPEGYRIVWGTVYEGTGRGDGQSGYLLQVYGLIKYRKWWKDYTYLGWATLERARYTEIDAKDRLIQTAHLHSKARNKND